MIRIRLKQIFLSQPEMPELVVGLFSLAYGYQIVLVSANPGTVAACVIDAGLVFFLGASYVAFSCLSVVSLLFFGFTARVLTSAGLTFSWMMAILYTLVACGSRTSIINLLLVTLASMWISWRLGTLWFMEQQGRHAD